MFHFCAIQIILPSKRAEKLVPILHNNLRLTPKLDSFTYILDFQAAVISHRPQKSPTILLENWLVLVIFQK